MTSEWTIETLKEHLLMLIEANDKRYKEESDNQKLAVKDALAAQKELTVAAFNSSEKAIVKAEEAQRSYNVNHNDLLRQMKELTATFITRKELWGWIIAVITLIIAIFIKIK
jgi:hypothetical protein